MLGIAATLSVPIETAAMPFMNSANTQAAIAACSTQRAPLLAKQRAYNDIKRARLQAAAAEGVKAGAGVLFRGMLTVIPGGALVAAGQSPRQAPQGSAQPQLFSEAFQRMNGLSIPGAASLTPDVNGQTSAGKPDAGKLAMVAVFVGIQSTVATYMSLKQEEFGSDRRRMAVSVEDDARGQLSAATDTVSEVQSLADCRQQQVKDLKVKIAGASNDKDRKQLLKDKSGLEGAIKSDIDVTNDVVDPQTNLARNFTQGRAMAEGKSEADVLGSQAPAYEATASHDVLQMPDQQTTATAPANEPPPQPTLVTSRKNTAVHTEPNVKSSVMFNFPAGRSVTPKGRAEADASWWEVDIGGTSGFIRGADLTEAGQHVGSKTKGPPPLAPPTNIRAYNQELLAARADGPDRLNTLNTDIETGYNRRQPRRHEPNDRLTLYERRTGEPGTPSPTYTA